MKLRIYHLILSSLVLTVGTLSARQSEDAPYVLASKGPVTVGITGFVNFRYYYIDNSAGTNTFDLRRARFTLKGNLYHNISYSFQTDLAKSPKVLDAFIDWKIADAFALKAGEYKIPFSLENLHGPLTLETIENAIGITKLCNYSDLSGINANGRDIGISAHGKFLKVNDRALFDYHVGLFNGNGINVDDNNKSKDFSGQVNVHPHKTLTFGYSHYNGNTYIKQGTLNGYVFDRDGSHQRIRNAYGVCWKYSRVMVRGEYLTGKTGNYRSRGGYGLTTVALPARLEAVVKYDQFMSDTKNSASREKAVTGGINYNPIKYIKVQFNYRHLIERAPGQGHTYALQLFGIF